MQQYHLIENLPMSTKILEKISAQDSMASAISASECPTMPAKPLAIARTVLVKMLRIAAF